MNIKHMGRHVVCLILERQVRVLRWRHAFTLVAVAGSVGKTSSKLAIAKVLASEKRVAYQEGNYNDRLTVPLVIFGRDRPASLYDLLGWAKVIARNQQVIRRGYPYDIAVVELGTDGPGQIAEFAYLEPDIAVVTAVAPEHMEFLGTLDGVAKEELAVASFSKQLLINADDVAAKYRASLTNARLYGLGKGVDYEATYSLTDDLQGEQVTLKLKGKKYKVKVRYLGVHGIKVVLSAVAVADMLGIDTQKIINAVQHLEPFSGRMRILEGKRDSTIIDDTYNSSPAAAKAALDVLYQAKASKRIALLGSMNELGETSPSAHKEVGEYCDPARLDVVVTVGVDANRYLGPAAARQGCAVVEFKSPYEAGAWVAKRLEPGTVVLAKGSQNGVFVEEALKSLLANRSDEAKLVRQSRYWIKRKRQQFPQPVSDQRVYQQDVEKQLGIALGSACAPIAFFYEAQRLGYDAGKLPVADFVKACLQYGADGSLRDSLRPELSTCLRERFGMRIVSWNTYKQPVVIELMRQKGYLNTPEEQVFFETTVQGKSVLELVRAGQHVIVAVRPGFAANRAVHAVVLRLPEDAVAAAQGLIEVVDPDKRNPKTLYSADEISQGLEVLLAGKIGSACSIVLPPKA